MSRDETHPVRTVGRLLAAITLSALITLGFAQDGEAKGGGQAEQFDVTVSDFMSPESVLHHDSADVYLVSNINGAPTATDDNGFISRLSPEGEVLELRWIDGENDEVELDAPKGMALVAGTLFVADISNVRLFDVETGEQKGSIEIEGSSFLNDVAAGADGAVYVTDTGIGPDFQPTGNAAVYRVSEDGSSEQLIASEELGMPNGVAVSESGELVVVTLETPGRIIRISDGEVEQVQEMSAGGFDGVVIVGDDELLVSSWSASAVLLVEPDGSATPVLEEVSSPADIDFDSGRGRVLIPLLEGNQVRIVGLPELQEQ